MHRRTGLVAFTIDSKPGATSGSSYTNEAKIIFDDNALYTQNHGFTLLILRGLEYGPQPSSSCGRPKILWCSGREMMIIRVLTNFKLLSLSMTNLSFAGTHLRKKLLIRFMVNLDTPTNFTPYPKTKVGNYELPPVAGQPDAETTPLNVGPGHHSTGWFMARSGDMEQQCCSPTSMTI